MPKLVYIATVPTALCILAEGQLAYFQKQGYDVLAVSCPGPDLDFVAQREGVSVAGIFMHREIRPFADLLSLWRMWRLLRRVRPDIVSAGTTKGGLLGVVAAWLARVPARIYLLRGLRLETESGMKRRILWLTERVASACAHRVVCVSKSLQQEFVAFRCAPAEKTVVLLQGSSNGVDANRFAQTSQVEEAARALRSKWGIPANAPVIGFVGRFTRGKGIAELVDAFDRVLVERPDAWLLLVGDYEAQEPVPTEYVARIERHPRIIRPGFIREVAPYYGNMSLFAFPTHREGFPNVVLQASAAGLPVVAFKATGAVDAVVDGVTGTIVELGNVDAFASAILRYLNDPELGRLHGQAGRKRAVADFRPETIWRAMDAQFRELLAKNGPAESLSGLSDSS